LCIVPVTEILVIIAQLIFLEGILSIDNAAVLGAMVSVLPVREEIPWPPRLRWLGPWGSLALGGQQAAALKVGLLGAYLGRGLMLVMASFIIGNPWLRLIGALYLFKLAISHLGTRPDKADESQEAKDLSGRNFWMVVLSVELADLAFSLDNVVAAVALSDKLWVVMVGVALGIVTMRFAAQAFTVAIKREPILATTAYLLVLVIGLELLLSDVASLYGRSLEFSALEKFAISLFTILASLFYAHNPWLQRLLRPLLFILGRLLGLIDQIIDAILYPIKLMFEGLVVMLRSLVRPFSKEKSSGS
jgi:tellurite resistance protein TerC